MANESPYKTIGDIDMKGALDDGEKAVEYPKPQETRHKDHNTQLGPQTLHLDHEY